MDLKTILKSFSKNGVCEVFIKVLSPNDNSKNQIYLGSEKFIHILPALSTSQNVQISQKTKARNFIFINHLQFFWINETGVHYAPNTKIIFYPQYPEVRLSGFLSGCDDGPNDLIGERNDIPRVLFLGNDNNGNSFGRVLRLTRALRNEIIQNCDSLDENSEGVFFRKELYKKRSLNALCTALRAIVNLGWIDSCKLKEGVKEPYKAVNGGGYTLEAHLGISPNGNAEPDYMGWEVKQHKFDKKVITLMTPDPDKGFAAEEGTEKLVQKYGYIPRDGKKDRKNFGGVYRNGDEYHHLTKVKLVLTGFKNGKITSQNGQVALIDKRGVIVAAWTFEKIMAHWTRKHYKAVYVPSDKRPYRKKNQYKYLNTISIGINSRFVQFLTLLEEGRIYLDPALNIQKNENGKMKPKTRYQFRVHKDDLKDLYDEFKEVII
jgi:MvaI/BcnI restriction endonuclease family